MKKEEIEFLKESNAIEGEYSKEALEDTKEAWEFAKVCNKKGIPIDIGFIKLVHFSLMKNLNPRIAGHIRKCDVWVGGRKGVQPIIIESLLIDLCNVYTYNQIEKKDKIKHFHIRFEHIHPFEDGNGRTGRILMNIQRLKIGLPILIIHEGKEQQEYYRWFK